MAELRATSEDAPTAFRLGCRLARAGAAVRELLARRVAVAPGPPAAAEGTLRLAVADSAAARGALTLALAPLRDELLAMGGDADVAVELRWI